MFTLKIDTGNAAFDDDAQGEVARILREVADKLAMIDRGDLTIGGPCYDENGNRVGEFELSTGRRS